MLRAIANRIARAWTQTLNTNSPRTVRGSGIEHQFEIVAIAECAAYKHLGIFEAGEYRAAQSRLRGPLGNGLAEIIAAM